MRGTLRKGIGRVHNSRPDPCPVTSLITELYDNCMGQKISTTVRLDVEDIEALARARADGVSTSDLLRKGLRVVAAMYYQRCRRPPSTNLFVSTSTKLGEETELFKDLEEWRGR